MPWPTGSTCSGKEHNYMDHTSRRRRSAVLGVALAGALTASTLAATASAADGAGDRHSRSATPATAARSGHGLPYQDASLPVSARVKDLLGRMTLAEKIGQMAQAERQDIDADPSLIT